MNTDPHHHRMTDAELDRAAAALLPSEPQLPPMRVDELLVFLIDGTREIQADLWTFRDAVDAHLKGERHAAAVTALGVLAELYDEATNVMRSLATELRIPLPAELYGPGWTAERLISFVCIP